MYAIRRALDTHHRVWLVLVISSIVMLFVVACDDDDTTVGPGESVGPQEPVGPGGDGEDGVRGSGEIVTEERSVTGFRRVELLGEGSVVITVGDDESLTVRTDDKLLELVETAVVDGTLEIRTSEGVDIAPSDSVVYSIGIVDLTGVRISGAGSVEVGQWPTGTATVAVDGVGAVRIGDLASTEFIVEFGGVGTVSVAGTTDGQDVVVSGVGDYDAGDLESRTATVTASGTSSATVWVTESLVVEVGDTATVSYYGRPDVTQEVTGLGNLTPLGDH